jgi:hypothetical protein
LPCHPTGSEKHQKANGEKAAVHIRVEL